MKPPSADEHAVRVEELLVQVEQLPDATARQLCTETVAALLALYGEGLVRIFERIDSDALSELAGDELIGHLMMLHDLHPIPVEERVDRALAEVRPYLESHGGGVELLGVESETVRLRLRGSCSGCPSSAMTLKLAVEDAIRKHAPEIDAVEAEGAVDTGPPAPALLQIENVGAGGAGNGSARKPSTEAGPAGDEETSWTPVGALPELNGDSATVLKRVAGEPLLFVGVERDRYAYRPHCPACGASLETADLRGAELACASCGRTFDVRRAGRCLDSPALHLEPVPLLVGEAGIARVAVAGAGAAA